MYETIERILWYGKSKFQDPTNIVTLFIIQIHTLVREIKIYIYITLHLHFAKCNYAVRDEQAAKKKKDKYF